MALLLHPVPATRRPSSPWWLLGSLCVLAACKGEIFAATPSDGTSVEAPGGPGGPGGPGTPEAAFSQVGLRRLTQAELRATLTDLLGADPGTDISVLPIDAATPFDNDETTQNASRTLVDALKSIADSAAARLVADAGTYAKVVGCQPTGPADEVCLRSFVTTFGRRALRRPLDTDEVERYVALRTAGDFQASVSMVVRAMLQHLEFVYRIEIGTPVPGQGGRVELTGYEVATRLSYLLTGSTPDDALLEAAGAGKLATPEGRATEATRLLTLPRARQHIARFHSMWLGYDRNTLPSTYATAMQDESAALIGRVVFDQNASWLDLFRAQDTFIGPDLAAHYGLPPPAGPGPAWVSYGASGRQGLLSHGSFLSVGTKFGDTSPTQRGKAVRERLFCQTIPPPPPGVVVDVAPKSDDPGACKQERYQAHATPGCVGCHGQMDPIGFGLENFDQFGAFRAHDNGRPECTIKGQGELEGVGAFRGPAEFSNLLVENEDFVTCFVTQLYRYAQGRHEQADDQAALGQLVGAFRSSDHRLRELLLDLVRQPAFTSRLVT